MLAHHAVEVPPLAGETNVSPARPGVRLMWRPITPTDLPLYCDVTSDQVNAMLEGFVHTAIIRGQRLGWSARGFGVHRRDTLHLRPLKDGE